MAYTLTADHTEPYTDGSGRYKTIFKKGDVIAWDTAYALGLVKTKTEPKEEPKKAQKEETQKG
jgi:hypothetical protein